MQTFKHTLGALALAALAFTGTAAQAQAVNNGTFDSDLSGWTTGPLPGSPGLTDVDWLAGTALFNAGTDRLAQVISGLVAGTQYSYSFSYASNAATSVGGIRLNFGGAAYNPPIETFAGTAGKLVTITDTFFATGSGNLIMAFRGAAGSIATLDNVSITAVPEPETYAMLLAGLGAVGFMSRRRKNLGA